MERFAELYRRLEETTRTSEKTRALREYLELADPADAAWAVYFLSGRRLKRSVSAATLREWAIRRVEIDEWLFEECRGVAGDISETITLILPDPARPVRRPLAEWVDRFILPLRQASEEERRGLVLQAWRELDRGSRLVWNKMLAGGFRIGVSRMLVVRGLSQATGLPATILEHRLKGNWTPSAEFFEQLVRRDTSDASSSLPYPFCLAGELTVPPETLGDPSGWLAEWKWEGVRAQLVRRNDDVFVWTRSDQLITDRCLEIRDVALALPEGTVLDGQILAWGPEGVVSPEATERLLGRTKSRPGPSDKGRLCYLAFDLMEFAGRSLRSEPLAYRRKELALRLSELAGAGTLCLSKPLEYESWEDLAALHAQCRQKQMGGIMLKDLGAPYGACRSEGVWWKWRVEPLTIDGVLLYACPDARRREERLTEFTFAVWDEEGQLVPFVRTGSGLGDDDLLHIIEFVRQNTVERFGPVRQVRAQNVFRIAFDALYPSTRHKSGVEVRAPRIQKWLTDHDAREADHVSTLHAMLPGN